MWELAPKKIPEGDAWIDHSSVELKRRQEENICSTECLVINEISRVMTTVLSLMSQVAGRAHNVDYTVPFGGLSMVLLEGFHQFSLVGNLQMSLYSLPKLDWIKNGIDNWQEYILPI